MNRTELGIELIKALSLAHLSRPEDKHRAIKDALGYEKPIRDMDKQEIEKVIQSIMGE